MVKANLNFDLVLKTHDPKELSPLNTLHILLKNKYCKAVKYKEEDVI